MLESLRRTSSSCFDSSLYILEMSVVMSSNTGDISAPSLFE